MNRPVLLLLCCILVMESCALFQKNRVTEHQGIEKTEFNLPVFLYPSKKPLTRKLLVFFSGDGGWVHFEDELALKFSEQGFQTIGINSRSYFWKQKKPQQAANDIVHLVRKYARQYKTGQIYFCGYSFGADVLPFIYNRLPFRAKSRVVALELLSPFATTDFKVHFYDLTNLSSDHYPYKVDLEVKKLALPVYCFYGIEENEKPLAGLTQKNFHLDSLSGNHHYDRTDYDKITAVLLNKK